MPKHLTTDADLDFPVPNAARLTARLREMYDGRTPVATQALAKYYGVSDNAIAAVLRRAELADMIRNVDVKGWIPLQT
jgi:hypothetical protein